MTSPPLMRKLGREGGIFKGPRARVIVAVVVACQVLCGSRVAVADIPVDCP